MFNKKDIYAHTNNQNYRGLMKTSPERKRKPNNAFIFFKKFTSKMIAADVPA